MIAYFNSHIIPRGSIARWIWCDIHWKREGIFLFFFDVQDAAVLDPDEFPGAHDDRSNTNDYLPLHDSGIIKQSHEN